MAKISNVIMFLKLLSIGFIVVVCIAGVIRAGIYIYVYIHTYSTIMYSLNVWL